MKQFISFVQKEFYHIFRDGRTILILLVMPIILIVLWICYYNRSEEHTGCYT